MERLDQAKWARREIYEMFSKMDYPFYSVTIPVDVTEIKRLSKARGVSFYMLMVWVCTKALNSVPEFRIRIRGDELVVLDQANPSFTYMPKGSEVFKIVTLPWEPEWESFCRNAQEQSEQQTCFIRSGEETDSLIYFSCTPWFDFTALTNEHNFDKDDTVPRLAWGKYFQENGRLWVHLSVEVNHRTIDGFHIGALKAILDREIQHLGEQNPD